MDLNLFSHIKDNRLPIPLHLQYFQNKISFISSLPFFNSNVICFNNDKIISQFSDLGYVFVSNCTKITVPINKYIHIQGLYIQGPYTFDLLEPFSGNFGIFYVNPTEDTNNQLVVLWDEFNQKTPFAPGNYSSLDINIRRIYIPSGMYVQIYEYDQENELFPGYVTCLQGIQYHSINKVCKSLRCIKLHEDIRYNDFYFLKPISDLKFEVIDQFKSKISLSLIQSSASFPTRHLIRNDNLFTLSCGNFDIKIHIHKRYNINQWIETDIFYEHNEKGQATGLIISDNFDMNATNEIDKCIFVTYQDMQTYSHKIIKISVSESDNKIIYDTSEIIWMFQPINPVFTFHQIMDGFISDSKLFFVLGDLGTPSLTTDMSVPHGKLMSIDTNGSDFKIHLIGLRDPYCKRLPKNIDSYERVWAVGNGNNTARTWLTTLGNSIVNMGYEIDDLQPSWSSVLDVNNARIPSPNCVLDVFDNDPSPNGHDFFTSDHNTSIIPPTIKDSSVSGVIAFFGHGVDLSPDFNSRGLDRTVCLSYINNLTAQPDIEITPIIKGSNSDINTQPLPVVIDKFTGNIIFSDCGEFKQTYLVEFI